MEETKSFLKSKTIIGLAVLLLGIGMKTLGWQPLDDAAANEFITTLFNAVGAILVLYGRIRAETKIGLSSSK